MDQHACIAKTIVAALLAIGFAPAQQASRSVSTELITPALRSAVDQGLRYLADTQHPDGYWAQDVGYKLNTNYNITKANSAHIGVSSLALISFMAGGHLPNRGEYGDNLERGLNYVLGRIHESGYITDNGSRMYSHAFATLFLAEIYGMTHRPDVRRGLQTSVNLIVDSQNAEGGWRYKPFARESDMSITVCQVLALRSARNVGITVSARTIQDAENYVRRSRINPGRRRNNRFRRFGSHLNEGGAFRYQLRNESRATVPLTAAGITTLHAAGIYDDPIITQAFDFLDAQLDQFNDYYAGHYFFYYGHYYAVQAYFTAGGRRWFEYFPKIRERLLREKRLNGSWQCTVGPGDAFATAVATLILQIPFQYLPIFQR